VKFEPHWPLRHANVQSALASFKPRNWPRRAHKMARAAKEHLLDCGEGVRLMGLHSAQPHGHAPKGLAVLIHGWEGSHDSVYLFSLACTLYDAGYNVFRLNLRDHGGTHALNRELFHSCRLPEVVGATQRLQALFPRHRLMLAGYSLGANFALRVGARARGVGLRIARIVAVCPVLDPAVTIAALESGPAIYHDYFMRKWRRSLRMKQEAWPGVYDFGDLIADRSLRSMTERMVLKYTDFPDLASYFAGYAITGGLLESLEAPARLITAADDPMIDARDLARLARPASLRITVTPRGGHCGYMEALRGPSWADRKIADELAQD